MAFDRGRALLIGVGSYSDAPSLDVPVTAADAQALAGVLRDPDYCGYPPDQVQILHDQTATRTGILDALDDLVARCGDDDTVLLFYCGHGDRGADGDYCLTTHDSRLQDSTLVADTALRQGELIERLRAVRGRRMLLLINACHSGALSPSLGPGEPDHLGKPLPAQTAEALLATGEGRIIVTACREDQRSYIGQGELTLFTQALVDGLQGQGTSSSQGFVSAYDLYTQVYFRVSEQVQKRYGLTQEPELTVLKGVGPFAVAFYPGAKQLGVFDATAPPPAGTAAHSVSAAKARAMMEQVARNSYRSGVVGGGAIAQGTGVVAVGQGAVHVGGNNQGPINTGTQTTVHTGGGAWIGGGVDTGGGTFVGRDQLVGVSSRDDPGPLLAQLRAAVARHAPADRRTEALAQVQVLGTEIANARPADDTRLAGLIDAIAGLVPGAAGELVRLFAAPPLRDLAGPVTQYVLDKHKAT